MIRPHFFSFNHQHKADEYNRALEARGWTRVSDPGEARFILSDMDLYRRAKTLEDYRKKGIKVFLYPHGGIPSIFWDFAGNTPSPFVSAHFVPAPGHERVMRSYGYPAPIEVVGWSLCPIKSFRPRPIRRVLFAPIHPNNNKFLCSIDKEINRESFRAALKIAGEAEASLLVRYLGSLRDNGLWKAGGADYLQGFPDGSFEEIDQADLVIAHHTMAYMSVARGVPTLMMGEGIAPRLGPKEEKLLRPLSWERYKDLMIYPLDVLEGDPLELAERASSSDRDICEWRERMIGSPFDPGRFIDRLESYL